MASILRLGSRQILNQFIRNEKCGMLKFVRPVTLKAQPVTVPPELDHDERNMKLGRPQSPHLSIYALEMTSMLSITHRATGMVLAGYTIMLGAGVLILPDTIPHYLDALAQAHVGGAVLFIGKLILAFPMTYHFWNGIRHLVWDLGKCLTIKEVYATGYAMLGISTLSAIALSAM